MIATVSFCTVVVVGRLKKTPVVAETPAHKQGHNLLMKTEQRRKRLKLGPTDMVIAESPMKFPSDSAIPSSLPTSQLIRHSSFYSEKPSRNISKYTKLEERMTQKVLSPPSQKFNSNYVAGSWLTSPRRITPKALFASLLSPSPSDKAGTNLPRKLDLKSPVRNVGCSASVDFKTPVKVVGSSASSVVAFPLRPVASSLSQLGLDSPSRNTRSHSSAGKQWPLTQQPEMLSLTSSLGRRYSRLMSPSRVPVTSPDFKRQPEHSASGLQSHVAKSSQSSVGKSPKSYDVANQMPRDSSKHETSPCSICHVHLTRCDDDASGSCSEMLNSGTDGMMKHTSDHSACVRGKEVVEVSELDKRSPKKKCLLVHQKLLPFSTTVSSLSMSAHPLDQSVDKTEDNYVSNCCGTLVSVVEGSDPHSADNNMSHRRKKYAKDVITKSSTRKRRYEHAHFSSPDNDQDPSYVAADVCVKKQSAEFATLSFGCDVESHDYASTAVVGQTENLHNVDVLRHLGSSGVESESSSNDVDLMIARKFLLDRKRSSGFQSLGHISETECCPSPVFPTISHEAVTGLSDQSCQHTASDSVSASPVFGKRRTQSFAGESPCPSLSGSGRKRTPVPGCIESFSPDVSQHSIAHLMTSPLLDVSDMQQKTDRSRSSTRRCLNQQMDQSGKRLSVGRHSSRKLTDEDR